MIYKIVTLTEVDAWVRHTDELANKTGHRIPETDDMFTVGSRCSISINKMRAMHWATVIPNKKNASIKAIVIDPIMEKYIDKTDGYMFDLSDAVEALTIDYDNEVIGK